MKHIVIGEKDTKIELGLLRKLVEDQKLKIIGLTADLDARTHSLEYWKSEAERARRQLENIRKWVDAKIMEFGL
jgi:hypothetical protein